MKWLTKSDYMKFLIHPAYLWLAKHAKDKLPPFDEAAQANVDQGEAVEEVARQLFDGGQMVGGSFLDGPDNSAKLLKPGGPAAVFQASVLTKRRLYARTDILVRQGDGWDLYEVKSATKVKPDHLCDVAFQKLAFTEAGYTIGRCFVMTVNAQYVRQGEVDAKKFLTTTEVTDSVAALDKATATQITKALAVMALPECPDDKPALTSNWYAWRDMYKFLYPELPADSIFNLTRLRLDQIKQLDALGVTTISGIPDNLDLGPQQRAQIEVAISGKVTAHREKIKRELDSLTYPLYFLDYETFASAVPLYDGVRPYQQLPFQYSVHILDKPGGCTYWTNPVASSPSVNTWAGTAATPWKS
jgi:hypothetical protein